jgi:hypothetical protein
MTDEDLDTSASEEEPHDLSADEVKEQWMRIQNVAAYLKSGNSPVVAGGNDFVFSFCDGKRMADYMNELFSKSHKPDPQKILNLSEKAGIPQEKMMEAYQEAYDQFAELYRSHAEHVIRNQFLKKMSQDFQMFLAEVNDQVRQAMHTKGTIKTPSGTFRFSYTRKDRDRFRSALERHSKTIKLRNPPKMRGSSSPFPRLAFAARYGDLKDVWHAAKDVYKHNRDNEDWRSHVKKEHPDLPENLIELLADTVALPNSTLRRLKNYGFFTARGQTVKPSFIALEHAARECGETSFSHKVQYLRDQLRTRKR